MIRRMIGTAAAAVLCSSLLDVLTLAPRATAGETETVDYARDVKPILVARCVSCHGSIRDKARLRLDAGSLILKGGENGPAVTPGHGEESLLIERVTETDLDRRMPPEGEGTALSPGEIAKLKAWIDAGAKTPDEAIPEDLGRHWAYRAPRKAPVPREGKGSTSIDRYLDAARATKGLAANPPARPEVWLRRVYLDLIGLPPTREQTRRFLDDRSPDAREKVVDALLASPRHGERWARHWMDVWRYSDWYGLGAEVRYSHPHIWRWRDWIIESLNANKGYDRMVVEMLAGDEVAPGDPATLRATGFLVRNWDIFNRDAWLANTVEHTAKAFLGMTIQCARCHDHKFDPISQTDYYKFRAFFEPYHIRLDRVPGQPDTTKDGLPRVFDDFLDRPTYLYLRGDEQRPDKSRPLPPALPAILSGVSLAIEPVRIPAEARVPDKLDHVVRTDLDESEKKVKAAEAELAKAVANEQATAKGLATAEAAEKGARGKPAEAAAIVATAKARKAADDAVGAKRVAEAALETAKAKHAAFQAVIAVERIEDRGGKKRSPKEWEAAATAARAAQILERRQVAAQDELVAAQALERATRTLDGLVAASADAGALKKASEELVKARARRAETAGKFAAAETESKAPSGTAYAPRALRFPRAKTTYRDVPPNTPYPEISSGRRLALARALTAPENPLVARVAVNHVWARHFGEPIVASPQDFGPRSSRPVLADLLDTLAVDFIESGWDMKRLHKRIVLSDAYGMSSNASPTALKLDPDNVRLWRANVKRMEGEVVRDALLHLAGNLDPSIGGPELGVLAAETSRRRTLYHRYARNERIPLLTAFDFANVEECYRRAETVVPQQALALMNSAAVLNRADEIARVVREDSGGDFVSRAFETILVRPPTPAERRESEEALRRLEEILAREKPTEKASARTRAEAAFVHVLLNHNDFVTIR